MGTSREQLEEPIPLPSWGFEGRRHCWALG